MNALKTIALFASGSILTVALIIPFTGENKLTEIVNMFTTIKGQFEASQQANKEWETYSLSLTTKLQEAEHNKKLLEEEITRQKGQYEKIVQEKQQLHNQLTHIQQQHYNELLVKQREIELKQYEVEMKQQEIEQKNHELMMKDQQITELQAEKANLLAQIEKSNDYQHMYEQQKAETERANKAVDETYEYVKSIHDSITTSEIKIPPTNTK
ncbi:hypothetical protein [Alkalihalobacillus pseudalcaliphilus]|uniref:hypothetical protein n=1 Tax=Alkalihalobacillus pseudalcaliphilus TaxID=79884 RepID=UPI00064DC326|nr:hypothetical protein [Alkalihalobacillus pseudalcaliphilus]KMK77443.1 hypothetical protein AB990_02910 [Alkalihalobacillus pseudalcaliphilus]